MKKILIGVPVLDNLEMTKAYLEKLSANTIVDPELIDITIFILDNGSTDDIAGMIRENFSDFPFPIHYRKNPRNLGVAIAWNQILRFTTAAIPSKRFDYDYYVISNNDALVGPDWLRPMVEAMESNPRVGWVATLENGSPLLPELQEAHTLSKKYRVHPETVFTAEEIHRSIKEIYSQWGGHDAFCSLVRDKDLPLFVPFKQEGRSAVCFMVRPAMIEQIGFFDEDYWPIGIAEDLEYFLRIERILTPEWLTEERYPGDQKWLAGYAGRSIVHHNWYSTRQGKNFDGRTWDKMREKHWKKKFRKSKKYYTKLLP